MQNVVISLFDYTGNWSRPYLENGYEVIKVDIKHGIDILTWDYKQVDKEKVYIILAAIPCDDYALSGARWFAEKDKDGRTQYSQSLVAKTKEIIDYFNVNYAIENPMSRIHILNPWMGKPKLKFHPYEYAGHDPVPMDSQYQKMTWIWGRFVIPKKLPRMNEKGAYLWREVWGTNPDCKEIRSTTPLGFAYAFYKHNNRDYKNENKSLFDF